MVLAHGLGGRSDLPVPLWVALYGGGMAVVISFVVLVAFWSRPRFEARRPGTPLPSFVDRALGWSGTRHVLAGCGLVGLAVTVLVALAGSPSSSQNPAPTWLYVWLWVGLVPASLFLGPVWRSLNPLRPLAAGVTRLTGRHRGERARPYPPHWGHWPAVLGLGVFLWLELVYPNASDPRTVAVFLTGYAIAHIAFAVRHGPVWFEHADSFEVYSTLIGRMAPWGRDGDGRLGWRNPFVGLASTPRTPGLVGVVCLVLGSTLFDGVTRTDGWSDLTDGTTGLANAAWGTAGLLAAVGAVSLTYLAATGLVRGASSRAELPGLFAHSLVPIAVGYTVAHYFSFFVFQGQAGYLLASDPLARGWDLFGTSGRPIDYLLVSPDTIAVVQVTTIVLGHVAGVLAAHDRAVSLFPSRESRRRQYPLMTAMVAFTLTGITLLTGAGT